MRLFLLTICCLVYRVASSIITREHTQGADSQVKMAIQSVALLVLFAAGS
jgi:hypothetical protein